MNKSRLICNVISAILLFCIIILSIIIFKTNSNIPIHWGLNGHIDSYGSSNYVLLDLIISIIIYSLIIFFEKNPHFCNLPWIFVNKERVYTLIQLNLTVINLLYMSYMTYMLYLTYFQKNLNPLITLVIFTIGIITTLYCLTKLNKLHKHENNQP